MLLSIMLFSFDFLMVLCDNIFLILSENGKPGAIPGRKVMGSYVGRYRTEESAWIAYVAL